MFVGRFIYSRCLCLNISPDDHDPTSVKITWEDVTTLQYASSTAEIVAKTLALAMKGMLSAATMDLLAEIPFRNSATIH